MIRGLYTSAWSMLVNSKQMDVIANNLANVNTNAYKKDKVILQTFDSQLAVRINDSQKSNTTPTGKVGNMEQGNDIGEIFTYYTPGQLVSTGNNLDFAISDSPGAFFTVGKSDDKGKITETFYTKDGSFMLNNNGQLTTKDGYLVLGEKGPIKLSSSSFEVDDKGTVNQNGQVVDKLLITEFLDTKTLRKIGSNLVNKTTESTTQNFSGNIKQGSIEQSNVNIVSAMVDMISVMRCYEANQKILQQQDNILGKAVTEIGTIR